MENFNSEESKIRTPFHAPEGYFNELPLRIQKQMAIQKPTNTAWAYAWKLALAPMLLLAIGYIFYNATGQEQTEELVAQHELLLQDVPDETILDYLADDQQINTLDLYDLADELYSDSESLLEDNFLEEVDVHELDEYL